METKWVCFQINASLPFAFFTGTAYELLITNHDNVIEWLDDKTISPKYSPKNLQ